PREMPSNNPKYFDALKAQAICARTYALKKMAGRKDKSFHVYGDHRDQVYGGLSAHNAMCNRAVEQTHGDVLKYEEQLATVFYHSSDGGISENAAHLWPAANVAYLKSQKDIIGQTFACSHAPNYRWQKMFTLQHLDSLFYLHTAKSMLKKPVTDTTRIHFSADVLRRSTSGRVADLKLTYSDTTIVLNDYAIRRFFMDRNGRSLPSTLFQLSARGDSTLVIQGGGFGHGAGMCQWGALKMSEMGFKYYDILVNHYFPGTYLEKVY
ncbi:MAG: SpoIID/LytB domain-containing protein, partial [Caldithrix sp.]|nr:SpoIID/LytB domain-containing protein [Caldithrix sp.]